MEFEIFLKIILSSLLGGLFGISREISGRGSGIRTIFLISTGSTLFSILSLELAKISKTADPSIIIALIIAGAALIGSSAVIRSTTFKTGLLTGTTLWTSAGIGIAVGLGMYLEAFLITVLIIMILGLFRLIDMTFRERSRLNSYTIKVKKRISALSDIKKLLMECGINNYEWSYEKIKSGFILELTIAASGNKDDLFTEKLMEMADIEEVRSDHI
ncbi:MAG: MgtC/SapB family protein [Candidatus Aminicenantes bacterium]|nr:MgtC/SapB family protein [Candidatus Aminicenantes bacterium]